VALAAARAEEPTPAASPIGRKLAAEQPAMLNEMTSVAQAWGENLAAEVMRKLEPEFHKRGLAMPNI
jgi:hypothetical protein